jgi:hypothetical protein
VRLIDLARFIRKQAPNLCPSGGFGKMSGGLTPKLKAGQ